MDTDYELNDLLHPIYHSIDDALKMLEKERLIILDKFDFLFLVKDLCNQDRISLEFRYIENTVIETAEVFSTSDMPIFHEVDEGKSPTEFYTLKSEYLNKLFENKNSIQNGVRITTFEESRLYITYQESYSVDISNPDHLQITSIFIKDENYVLYVEDLFFIDQEVKTLLDIIDTEFLMRIKDNRIKELEKKLAHIEATALTNRFSKIDEKNLINSLLKGTGIAIAEYLWEMDIEKQIRKSDMARQVASILYKVHIPNLGKNLKISKETTISDWLIGVAPLHAKKGGRPTNDSDQDIILRMKK